MSHLRDKQKALARLHSGGSLSHSHAFTAECGGSLLAPTGLRDFMEGDFLTTSEAAERLGLTVRAVQKMIQAGRLVARKSGRDYLIEESALKNIPKVLPGRPPKSAQLLPVSKKKRAAK